jgi:hypothetical protein
VKAKRLLEVIAAKNRALKAKEAESTTPCLTYDLFRQLLIWMSPKSIRIIL